MHYRPALGRDAIKKSIQKLWNIYIYKDLAQMANDFPCSTLWSKTWTLKQDKKNSDHLWILRLKKILEIIMNSQENGS